MSLLRQDYEQAKKRLDNNYEYFKPQEYLRSQLKLPFMRFLAKLRSIGINSSAEHNWHDRSTVKFVDNINHDRQLVVRYEMVESRDKCKNEKAHKQYVSAVNKNRDRRRRVGRRIR